MVCKPKKASNLRTTLLILRDPWRMHTALLLALLIHALLLSISLGGQTFGLPGLNFPWKERRLGANELRILLAPAQPANTSPIEQAKTVLAAVDKPEVARAATAMTMPPSAIGHSEAAAVLIPPPTPAPKPAVTPEDGGEAARRETADRTQRATGHSARA
jgi:hypothetical protein